MVEEALVQAHSLMVTRIEIDRSWLAFCYLMIQKCGPSASVILGAAYAAGPPHAAAKFRVPRVPANVVHIWRVASSHGPAVSLRSAAGKRQFTANSGTWLPSGVTLSLRWVPTRRCHCAHVESGQAQFAS